jgi:hypothetical protein
VFIGCEPGKTFLKKFKVTNVSSEKNKSGSNGTAIESIQAAVGQNRLPGTRFLREHNHRLHAAGLRGAHRRSADTVFEQPHPQAKARGLPH